MSQTFTDKIGNKANIEKIPWNDSSSSFEYSESTVSDAITVIFWEKISAKIERNGIHDLLVLCFIVRKKWGDKNNK